MKKPDGQKKFGTSVSFDLDLPSTKSARREKKAKTIVQTTQAPVSSEVGCPGCGATISQEQWIEALVGFVSGAQRYDMGGAVTSDVVQTLRNTVSNMDLPQPRDVWELSIVARLTREFDLLLQEGIERTLSEMGDVYTRQEVEAYAEQVRMNTLASAEHELAARIETELRAGLEHQLRREIEQELWKQFDEELKRRSQQD